MNSFESWILSYLVNSVWQIPLLFAAGWIAARALRRVGADAEHRVWVTVLMLQVLLPACSVLPLDWLRSLSLVLPHAAAEAKVSVITGAGAASSSIHVPTWIFLVVTVGYVGVTLWFVVRFLWRWTRLTAIRQEAVPALLHEQMERCRAELAAAFGVGAVAVLTSSRVFSPVTMGLRRRFVVLPAGMLSGMAVADFQTVLAHEFAHIRRRDFLRNLIYEALALPLSYHPLLALTRARLMETREIVCDQMAAEIAGRKQYARSLLRLASLLTVGAPIQTPHTIGIFDTNTLERRLMNLTERRTELRGVPRTISLAACLALGAGACASALALRVNVNAFPQASEHPPAHPNAPVAVSPKVMAGQKISGPIPVYPPEAKKERIQGTVLIDVVISKEGNVLSPEVTSGPKELRDSAVDAVRQWKYKPFLLNGEPIEVKTTIHVVYTLKK